MIFIFLMKNQYCFLKKILKSSFQSYLFCKYKKLLPQFECRSFIIKFRPILVNIRPVYLYFSINSSIFEQKSMAHKRKTYFIWIFDLIRLNIGRKIRKPFETIWKLLFYSSKKQTKETLSRRILILITTNFTWGHVNIFGIMILKGNFYNLMCVVIAIAKVRL